MASGAFYAWAGALSMAVLLATASPVRAAGFEPMFRGNPERTGFVADGPQAPLALRWKFATRRGVDQIESFPAVDDGLSPAVVLGGVVYVGGHDGWIYAIDAATGRKKWDFQTHSRVNSTPTPHDGVIFVGSMDNFLYALGADDGELVWRAPFGSKFFKQISYGGVRASPVIHDGAVYVGG
ncbi:MAG: PQQ-binding-like beta-propeller repeat protein [Deferrisomatales bacterium]|nr:PQQ-binding-like beta-propeller repeat protein [Deferrisomatales bacterium]